ncbi:Lactonase, 7-bladed beta-propeller-domain-containing protein [Boeremia exigua]|uniref:Lactonase, 7-bladed beta-propeller-domain-containing protein n=1 Tax=Boeremia exigua TaxID=749465 RepID=UPI001E8D4A02|nr:Lactonase, 7-bladed beta-propeller-domain-containing protein [Boeremia exigua]KAH6639882.1 Lactonase, 7-bladed beta-propeller-domain-containing protein [Boeremia exigua]
MYSLISSYSLIAALFLGTTSGQQLFAAHSDGNVTTLALTGTGNASRLSVTSVSSACDANPATLNLDYSKRILYCLDRGRGTSQGSLNSFSIDAAGKLNRIARVSAPPSGVTAEFFDVPGTGVRGYVSASYNRSAIGVFRLGENGALTEPLQTILPNLTSIGPVPLRQDRSYLHHVILDPTGEFLLMADLGGDQIRVFTYNKQTIAPLKELAPLVTGRGVGPRHAVFWRSPKTQQLYLFFNGELDQRIYTYRVKYTKGGISWTLVSSIASIGDHLPATTSPTSEIAVTPDGRFVIVSNRDVSFAASTINRSAPSDTLSVFSINSNGTLKAIQHTPSGGYSPRQFMINKAGDKIAVGHQNNNTVVVWKRNVETGLIVTEAEGGKLGVATLTGAVVYAQWDE